MDVEVLTRIADQLLRNEALKFRAALLKKGVCADLIDLGEICLNFLDSQGDIKIRDNHGNNPLDDFLEHYQEIPKLVDLIKQETKKIEESPEILGNFTPENLRRLKAACERQLQRNEAAGYQELNLIAFNPKNFDLELKPGSGTSSGKGMPFEHEHPLCSAEKLFVIKFKDKDPCFISPKDFLDDLESCAVRLEAQDTGALLQTGRPGWEIMLNAVFNTMKVFKENMLFLKTNEEGITQNLERKDKFTIADKDYREKINEKIIAASKGTGLREFSGNIPVEIDGYSCNISWSKVMSKSAAPLFFHFSSPEFEKEWIEKLGIVEITKEPTVISFPLFFSPQQLKPLMHFMLEELACQVLEPTNNVTIETMQTMERHIMDTVALEVEKSKMLSKNIRGKNKGGDNFNASLKEIQALGDEISSLSVNNAPASAFCFSVSLCNPSVSSTVSHGYLYFLDKIVKNKQSKIFSKIYIKYSTDSSTPDYGQTLITKSLMETASKESDGVILVRYGNPELTIRLQDLLLQVKASLTEERDSKQKLNEEAITMLKENYPEEVFEYSLGR